MVRKSKKKDLNHGALTENESSSRHVHFESKWDEMELYDIDDSM
jgi:hypothetical protein